MLDIRGVVFMRRDMEIIRNILIETGNGKSTVSLPRNESSELLKYQYEIAEEKCLIRYKAYHSKDRFTFSEVKLTSLGNDLLDEIENDTVWGNTKDFIKTKGLEIGKVSLSLLKDIAIQQGKKQFGLE